MLMKARHSSEMKTIPVDPSPQSVFTLMTLGSRTRWSEWITEDHTLRICTVVICCDGVCTTSWCLAFRYM